MGAVLERNPSAVLRCRQRGTPVKVAGKGHSSTGTRCTTIMDSTRTRCARLRRRAMMSDGSEMHSTAVPRQCLLNRLHQCTVLERGGLLIREDMVLEPLRYTSTPEWVLARCHRISTWVTLARSQVTAMTKGTIREAMRHTTREVVKAPAVGPRSNGGILQDVLEGMVNIGLTKNNSWEESI